MDVMLSIFLLMVGVALVCAITYYGNNNLPFPEYDVPDDVKHGDSFHNITIDYFGLCVSMKKLVVVSVNGASCVVKCKSGEMELMTYCNGFWHGNLQYFRTIGEAAKNEGEKARLLRGDKRYNPSMVEAMVSLSNDIEPTINKHGRGLAMEMLNSYD